MCSFLLFQTSKPSWSDSPSDSEDSLPDIPEDSPASVPSNGEKTQAEGQSLDLAKLWRELEERNKDLGVPSDLEPYGGWDIDLKGRRPLTYLDQDGKITTTKRRFQERLLFEESSEIRKLIISASSTISKPGSKFLTPTKKLDYLWPSRTIPQNREASPRPFAYIDLTDDPGMSYDQPSSTTLENEGQLEGIQM